MDIKAQGRRLYDFFKKYRYVALILAIGLILMMIPDSSKESVTAETVQTTETEDSLDERLSAILSRIDGAGKVYVMLSVAAGKEILYQTDNDISSGGETSNQNINTVVITDADRNQTGLVRQIKSPIYQGAIIVCEGGDQAAVRYAIVDAITKLTGLGANQVSVLKMK